jgi:O-acetylserine/cysteine efflux transporter
MSASAHHGKLPSGVVPAAVLIAAIWGFNFVVIKVGVVGVPPLMLAALRFIFSALPAIFFVRKPDAPMRSIAIYGLLLGVGEFGLLFSAIKLGAPAGLCSILLQSQAFFTAILGTVFLKEKLKAHNIAGMLMAGCGLALFGLISARASQAAADLASAAPAPAAASLSPLLLGMILAAALSWAGANIVARTIPKAGGLGLMVWSSLFSPLPLMALSLLLEGTVAIGQAFVSMSALTVGAIAYLAILSTLLGYGLWNQLIMRHGAGRIAQFSLMVPVFALASSTLVLGERFGPPEAAASLLILAGLLIHVFGGSIPGERMR